jgi:crotonobetainyl-CoA:carnitine CoA-transferase CaiB-like acyl-CoA transferase
MQELRAPEPRRTDRASGAPLAELVGGRLRVLDLSRGVAGGYCTKLLADAGADVVMVEPEGGGRLRRWSATAGTVVDDSALWQFLHTSKRSITGSPGDEEVLRLASMADIVVEDLEPGALEASGFLEIPGLVVVSISPYGRRGPWAARPAADLIIQAESGCINGRGLPGGEPFAIGGRTFDFVAGSYAATAGLAAVRVARRSGRGEHVDVSTTEAASVGSFACHAEVGAHLEGLTPEAAAASTPQRVEIPSIEPTSDGWVGFTTNSRQQFDDFLLLIERPDLIGDERFAMQRERWHHFDQWNTIVHAWTRDHSTEDVINGAVALRIPVAPIATAATVLTNPHFAARGVFEPNPSGGFAQPRCPYRISGMDRPAPAPVPAPGEHSGRIGWEEPPGRGVEPPALPLAGLKVLDMTAWFAGPLAAHLLAVLGANVIHLESTTHMDGMRATGGAFAARYPSWWECSSQFLSVNTDKLGLTLDLGALAGRAAFQGLVAWADVLIENFTPRVMDNFGFTWDALREINPQLVMVRMPAFGLDGPWRDRTGFAQTMEQVTGLAWVTGHADDQPRIQRGPCDIVSGVHAVFSTLIALDVRSQRGEGVVVESTMVEAALNAAAEQIVEYGKYGHVMSREGNRSPWAAPQGLYRTADGNWLAVAIETDAEWEALCRTLDSPRMLHDARLSDLAGRRAHHDELDSFIAAWVADHYAAAAVDKLVGAGVPAGLVADQRFLASHPSFAGRGFFEEMNHPVAGRLPHPGVPFRFSSVSRWLHRPAPTLGEHNTEILAGFAGLLPEQIDELADAGVIGDRPAGL